MTPPDDLPPIDARWGQPGPMHDPHALAHFRARPTDVLITTAPKAGTTWMQQILHQLRTGGDESFGSIFDVVPWLERRQPGRSFRQVLDDFDRIPEPRVFKTHCTYEQTPGTDTARIILTFRDPRDCVVSMYHHLQDMTDEAHTAVGLGPPPSEFEAFFETWMSRRIWFRNVSTWWPHRDDPNVLLLRYEELVRDLGGAVDRILEHVGWRRDAGQRARALELSSFEWMAAHRDKFTRLSGAEPPQFKPGGFIRKGVVGDHKRLLRPEQERRLLDEARASLEPECVAFLGLA